MITSLRNPRVAEAMKLRKRGLREDRRRFLVEGPQAVGEALKASGLEILFHIPEAGLHPHVSALLIDITRLSGNTPRGGVRMVREA